MIVLRQILARVAVVVIVFFGLMALIESMNTGRLSALTAVGGPLLGLVGIIVPALRWSIGTLPITVLIGTMAGVLDLQSRLELTIIKASGVSLWRVIWLPVAVVFAFAATASLIGESWTITMDRSMSSGTVRFAGPLWLEQSADGRPYILYAEHVRSEAPHLEQVTIFDVNAPGDAPQIVAATATLLPGRWQLHEGTVFVADNAPAPFETMEMATLTTIDDLQLKVSRAHDLTMPELLAAAMANITDPSLRAVSTISFYRAFTLPIMVVGAMLLAFALTARYRRRGNYGGPLLQGLVVGFVLFVLNEMAIRAGNAQVITPLAATAGPAFVSVLVGLTALLFLEDGYA